MRKFMIWVRVNPASYLALFSIHLFYRQLLRIVNKLSNSQCATCKDLFKSFYEKMTDVELKNKGNKLYASRKFDEAIKCYSEAISKKPSVAVYYTNRALCNLKLKRWELVCQDCRTALELDSSLVKAHFFLGQALLETENYDESIKHLQRAQDLAKEQKVNYGDDIACVIRVARKRRFNVAEEKRITQEIELQSYLNRLVLEDRDRSTDEVQNKYDGDEDKAQEEIMKIEEQCYFSVYHDFFNKKTNKRR
ncbi:unnamed protein product, partial [Meganyctiphanes norvegica]